MATAYFDLFVHVDLVDQLISVRESVWNYNLLNLERFKVHLPNEFDKYIETMLEYGEGEVKKLELFLNI